MLTNATRNQQTMKYATASFMHNFVGDTGRQVGKDVVHLVYSAYKSGKDVVTDRFAFH